MKKIILAMMVISLFPMASALALFGHTVDTLNLFEKNPSWEIVDGASGVIKFSTVNSFFGIVQERASVTVYGLEPKTSYQLIYYGNEDHNDVWPYATCVGRPMTTNTNGYFKSGSGKINHVEMANDDVAQKFWVVLADDVDCENGVMTAWNPTEYLFEEHTI